MISTFLQSAGGAGLETVWSDLLQDRATSLAKPAALLATQYYIDVLVETSDQSELKAEDEVIVIGKNLYERGLLDKQCFSTQLVKVRD